MLGELHMPRRGGLFFALRIQETQTDACSGALFHFDAHHHILFHFKYISHEARGNIPTGAAVPPIHNAKPHRVLFASASCPNDPPPFIHTMLSEVQTRGRTFFICTDEMQIPHVVLWEYD